MCGGGGSKKSTPAPTVYQPNPNAVADNSNDAAQRQSMVAASTSANPQISTFGSELGASTPGG